MTPQEVLEKHKIPFRISGRDLLIRCVNPDHEDSSPSMRIDQVLGIFHCLSCGYRGNIFYFLEETFDKKSILAERIKLKLEDIRAESIGLEFPPDMMPVTKPYRVSLDTLTDFEAFKSLRPEFKDRIVFPIRDMKGNISCFIGRSEDRFEKKRYNVYPRNSLVPLFPLLKLKPNKGRVLLVEGLFDLLNLYDNGFKNVLCCFGTNTMKKERLEFLKLLGVSHIDICFDPDDPGQDAAGRLKEMATELFFSTRNINLKTVDPGDLSKDRAKQLYQKLYGD